MKDQSTPKSGSAWTGTQVYSMAVICLLLGVAIGYLVRGSSASMPSGHPQVAQSSAAQAPAQMGNSNMGQMQQQPTPDQLKHMAEVQAAPMIERLKKEPENAQLLADIGNLYYDAGQFPTAIDYYQRSLKIQPGNGNVRVDLGTAHWYLGDADKAIAEYKTVLKTEPNKPNALMNLGVVEWQGKMDVDAAVAAWQKLLDSNPNFQERDKVLALMAQAKKHSSMKLPANTPKS